MERKKELSFRDKTAASVCSMQLSLTHSLQCGKFIINITVFLMPHFQHCGETHYKVCSLTDKVNKICHAHKYALTLYLLYANWMHYLKLMDLT